MSGLIDGTPWPLAVLVWPLLVALLPALPGGTGPALRLLPVAPLPALVFAIWGNPGSTAVPDLLLGMHLGAVPAGMLLLGMTAAVWAAAGLHAALTIGPDRKAAILCGFWCVTLAGNLGVFLAADVVTFYVAFAAVSLAAWFLVVHDRTAAALRAGRVYIVMAVAGEVALLAGLVIGMHAAAGTAIADVRLALSAHPAALALIMAGFAIKAGMVPLHVWLPLAHPAAPVPGSAVLSGAIVKAGLIGVILFLPDAGGWGATLVAAGLAGAFGAALWGLTQDNPKAVLAYSTVSQMGLMLMLAGVGQAAAAFHAMHHGLAKAALFLLVGTLAAAATGLQRRATLVLTALVAASVVGLPLTGGALTKAAAKDGLDPVLSQALTFSAATTALLLIWLLHRLAQSAPGAAAARASWAWLMAGPLALTTGAFLLPWLIWEGQTASPLAAALEPGKMLAALWPVLPGAALAIVLLRRPLAARPPGDLLLPLMQVAGLLQHHRLPQAHRPAAQWPGMRPMRLILRLGRAEALLQGWRLSGWLMLAGSLGLALLLIAG